jgi:uncharacterized repeat protein (TIGR03803 family)
MKQIAVPFTSILFTFFAAVIFLAAAATTSRAATPEQTIYTFSIGSSGWSPVSSLIGDKRGNLYGTTVYGGDDGGGNGYGVVFELSPTATGNWTEIVLYSFLSATNGDGNDPAAALVMDSAGNLYGTTVEGGLYSPNCGIDGCGTIFKLSPPATQGQAWTETVLYAFQGGNDGANPFTNVILGAAGNLFGTTSNAGASGYGTVFELTPPAGSGAWTETTLHGFSNGGDGAVPYGGLVFGKDGALYGTTYEGGTFRSGTIYRLALKSGVWTYRAIYGFNGTSDGAFPESGLTVDKLGNLYGTTYASGANGFGTVFEVNAPMQGSLITETVLYNFQGGTDSGHPGAGVIFDKSGSLYGTTTGNGTETFGTVFQLAPPAAPGGTWSEKVLHSFDDRASGANPSVGVVSGKAGDLYGTASGGAGGVGIAFRVVP